MRYFPFAGNFTMLLLILKMSKNKNKKRKRKESKRKEENIKDQDFCYNKPDKDRKFRGAWVARLVECPTSAQVMISQFVSSNSTSGSVLTAQSLESALDPVSPSVSLPLPCSCSVSLSTINKH